MKIAINGAGIAGTTLAYWLCKFGHQVLLIEESAQLRRGGYVINFWGLGYDVIEKMGLLPRLQALQYHTEELRLVDSDGHRCGGYPAKVLLRLTRGRLMALARSDIAAIIYEALDAKVERLFGDSIAAIEDAEDCLRISFDHAPPREVDLVVGADGLHSRVRRIAFGADTRFEFPLRCHVAAFEIQGYRPRDELVSFMHGAPGRYISKLAVRDGKTLFFLVFRDEYLAGAIPASEQEHKSALAGAFADVGWECPQIIAALDNVSDIYFDSVGQIRMDHWTKGRVALVGDAAACPSLISGEGAGLAIAEAYALACEIHESGGEYRTAFSRYETRMMPFLKRKQESAAKLVSSFVPESTFGVKARDFATRLMRLPGLPELLMGRYLHDDLALPDYSR